MFTNFSGFAQAAAAMPADRMVVELNAVFAAFDDLCDEEGVEKSKTSGIHAALRMVLQRRGHSRRWWLTCRRATLRAHSVGLAGGLALWAVGQATGKGEVDMYFLTGVSAA